jgi:hypothetical protein
MKLITGQLILNRPRRLAGFNIDLHFVCKGQLCADFGDSMEKVALKYDPKQGGRVRFGGVK